MKLCPSCKKENEDFFVFCLSCGGSLVGASEEIFAPVPLGDEAVPAVVADKPTPPADVSISPDPEVGDDQGAPRHDDDALQPISFDEFEAIGADFAVPLSPAISTLETPEPETSPVAEPDVDEVVKHTSPAREEPQARPLPKEPTVDDDLPFLAPLDRHVESKRTLADTQPPTEKEPEPVAAQPTPISQKKKKWAELPTRLDASTKTFEVPDSSPVDEASDDDLPMILPSDWTKPRESSPRLAEATVPDIASPPVESETAKAKKRTRHGRKEAKKGGPADAHLVLIRDDGTDGDRFDLFSDTTCVGSTEADINFADDEYMARRHAVLFYEGTELRVRALDKRNGVFRRIDLGHNHALKSGDQILIGQELLLFRSIDELAAEAQFADDGTQLLGSPVPEGAWGVLYQRVTEAENGQVYLLVDDEVSLGRDEGDITFPDDSTVSGSHAAMSFAEGVATIRDLQSKNGTYVRLDGTTSLSTGDVLLIGRQLLRVEA